MAADRQEPIVSGKYSDALPTPSSGQLGGYPTDRAVAPCPLIAGQSRHSRPTSNRCYADVIMKDVKARRFVLSPAFCSSIDPRKTTEEKGTEDSSCRVSLSRRLSKALLCFVAGATTHDVDDDSGHSYRHVRQSVVILTAFTQYTRQH